MTIIDLVVLVMIVKMVKRMWSNYQLRSPDIETFRLKLAKQEMLKFKSEMNPKPKLTKLQFVGRVAVVYFVLSQFSWIPKK